MVAKPSPRVIAVDGPAASGKGTLAKRLAAHFGYAYLDTGSIYRAVGYHLRQQGKDPNNAEDAIAAAKALSPDAIASSHLYDEGVGKAASIVAAIPEVRASLFDFQQQFARKPEGAVLDGRDIGTVICPQADFKFFITADIETRAERRYKQLQNNDNSVIYQSVLDDLARRDARDSQRSIAPLKPAEDAISIDTTYMDAEAVFHLVLSHMDCA